MTIEQDVLRFHEQLTIKRITKYFHYKLVYNIQSKIIIIGCIILYISSMCIAFRSMFSILEIYKTPIMWIAIIDSIIIFIILCITDDFLVIINEQKKRVNLVSIKREAIYLYLIKQKYISKDRDNSCFYSSVLQFTQFSSTKWYNESPFKSFVLIISIGFPILSLILGENANTQIKIASTMIAISTCAFISILFYFLRLKGYNRSRKYQDLHSLILSIQLEDSIKRKI